MGVHRAGGPGGGPRRGSRRAGGAAGLWARAADSADALAPDACAPGRRQGRRRCVRAPFPHSSCCRRRCAHVPTAPVLFFHHKAQSEQLLADLFGFPDGDMKSAQVPCMLCYLLSSECSPILVVAIKDELQ